MVRDEIIKVIKKASGIEDPHLEFSTNQDFGDYSSNVALKNKELNIDEIVEKINSQNLGFTAESKGKFINFWLKTDILVDNLTEIDRQKEKYGTSDIFKNQKIMFEYAHPNTHKAFHIGHLRNITTGETLSRLYETLGAEIIRANYQGDVGLHIAKALWGIKNLGFTDSIDIKKRAEFLGKAYANGATAYEEDEKIKEEIHTINGKIYDKSDEEINKLYKETRQWSLDYFDEIYKRVYTKFDRLYFESETAESGKQIALEALKKGILKESEGAIIFPGSEYDLHDRVFISGKGVPTYEAKELGLAKIEFSEYNPDLLIHLVAPEQAGYFQVLFKALEFVMPETKGREMHVQYGWVRLKEGKMSSRTGNVILGEAILDEAKENILKSYKTSDEVAEQIAVGAVKYSFLKSSLNQDIAFDLKESISLEGNSGPYLQYTVARTNSVLGKKSASKGEALQVQDNLNIEELSVLRTLNQFSEVVGTSAINYSPNLLCNYLYDLASKYNVFYNKNRVLESDNENFRLKLTSATGQVLKNGLKLLGIQTPERM